MLWFTLKMPAVAKAGPGKSQEPGASLESPMGPVAQADGLSSTALLGRLTES